MNNSETVLIRHKPKQNRKKMNSLRKKLSISEEENKRDISFVNSGVQSVLDMNKPRQKIEHMTKYGELYSAKSFGRNDYCKFERGLVMKTITLCNGRTMNIFVPLKKGSGSRGSRF